MDRIRTRVLNIGQVFDSNRGSNREAGRPGEVGVLVTAATIDGAAFLDRAVLLDRVVAPGVPPARGRRLSEAPSATTTSRQQPPLRLTRRGRLAVTLLVAMAALLVGLLGARTALAATSGSTVGSTAVEQVTVLPGDTLWSIAQEVGASGDVRDRIAQIRSLNDLETSSLAVGQQLIIPAS